MHDAFSGPDRQAATVRRRDQRHRAPRARRDASYLFERPEVPGAELADDLLGKRASVRGWYGGTAVDSEDTLLFSQRNDIALMNEIFPLEEAQAAYDRMMSGKARFRVVLKIDS